LQERIANSPAEAAKTRALIAEVETIDPGKILRKSAAELGNIYTVELLPDEDALLDWDKPLNEQSARVQAALAPLIEKYRLHFERTDSNQAAKVLTGQASGAAFYVRMTIGDIWEGSPAATPREASALLAQAGIPGIRYWHGGSEHENTHNYVIFDERLVRIVKKNGEAMRAAFARRAGLPDDRIGEVTRRLRAERGGETVAAVALKPHTEQEAVAWARENLLGETLHNPDTGFAGVVSGASLKKMLIQRKEFPEVRAAAIYELPQIMQVAKGMALPGDPRDPLVTRTVFLFAPVTHDGQTYRLRLVGKEFADAKDPKIHSYRIEEIQVEKEKAAPRLTHSEGQGPKTNAPSALPEITLEQLLAESKPDLQFVRRANSDAEFNDALRNYDRLEREAQQQVERYGKTDRALLEELSEARMVLENSWPGWREAHKEMRAETEANEETPTEPEQGVGALDDEGRQVRPEVTRAKVSALMASHYRPVGTIRQWIEGIGRLLLIGNWIWQDES
jgi:hypothetical protein